MMKAQTSYSVMVNGGELLSIRKSTRLPYCKVVRVHVKYHPKLS